MPTTFRDDGSIEPSGSPYDISTVMRHPEDRDIPLDADVPEDRTHTREREDF